MIGLAKTPSLTYTDRGAASYRQVHGRIEYAIDIGDGCLIYRGTETKEAYRFCKVPRKEGFLVAKDVHWIEDEQLLAVGSDHGKLYVFDDESTCLQRLGHGSRRKYVILWTSSS